MKSLTTYLFLISALFSAQILANTISFMPENNLQIFDDQKTESNVTEEQFNRIIDVAEESYQIEADEANERIKIKRKWKTATVNANMRRFWGKVTINMYGGLARHPEMTPDGFALVLCHELGHAYGGLPYLRPSSNISAEGQSDYYGAKNCLKRVMKEIEVSPIVDTILDDYMVSLCTKRIEDIAPTEQRLEYELCTRGLVAGQSLGNLLAVIMERDLPNFSTPDPLEVYATELSYPKTVQCRLDTYRAGTLLQDRPLCWYNPERNVL